MNNTEFKAFQSGISGSVAVIAAVAESFLTGIKPATLTG